MGDNETEVAGDLVRDNLLEFFIRFKAVSSIYDE